MVAAYALSETPVGVLVEAYALSETETVEAYVIEAYALSETAVIGALEAYVLCETTVVTTEYWETFEDPTSGAFLAVANEAARLALVAGTDPGEIAESGIVKQLNTGVFWRFLGGDPSDADNWLSLGTQGTHNAVEEPAEGEPQPWPFTARDDSYPVSRCFVKTPDLVATWDGFDILPYLKDLKVSGKHGQAYTGSVVLLDRDEELVEPISRWSPSNEDVRAHDRTDDRSLGIRLTCLGVSPDYPRWIPTDPIWGPDGTVTINFSDYTPIANLDNQSLEDVLYDEGDRKNAHQVLRELGTLAGITIQPRFKDFPLRTWRMAKENVLNKIDELCQIRQARRRFEGKTMILEAIKTGTTGTLVQDRFHIPEDGWSMSHDTSGLKTLFKAFRLAPMPTALSAPADCTGGQCVGRVIRIDFQQSVIRAVILAQARDGTVVDGVFFDENDEPLNNTPAIIYNGTPTRKAKYWLATYKPMFTRLVKTLPYWRIEAYGGSTQSNDVEAFDAQKIITQAEALFGRRPEYTNFESELFLKAATATEMLEAVAKEVLWNVKRASLTTPFLLKELCGEAIRVTHYGTEQNMAPFIVDSFDHSLSPADGFSASYGLRGFL